MEGSAPTETIQSAEQPTTDLHSKVGGELKKAGYDAAAKDINPKDDSALEKIQDALGDAAHIADTTFGATLGSEVNYTRGVEGKDWRAKLNERTLGRFRGLSKKAA